MQIRKIAFEYIKERNQLREQVHFGIKPEAYRLKHIQTLPLSENFKIKY